MRHLKNRSYYEYRSLGQYDHSKTLRDTSSEYSPGVKPRKKLEISFQEKKSMTQTQRTDVSKPFFQSVINRISNNLDASSTKRVETSRPEGLRIPLERIPSFGITLNEVPSPDKRSQTKTLESIIPDISPIARNHSRTQTTIGERPRITLKLLDGSRAGTQIIRDNSDNSPTIINQSGNRYHVKRGAGSTTRNFYRGDQSTTGINETSQNITWRTVNQSISRYPLNVREQKINKILQDVQVSLEIDSGQNILSEESPGLSSRKKRILRTSSPLGKGSPIKESRVVIVDTQTDNNMNFKDISQKLGDFRSYIKNQLVDLSKVRAPLKLKTKSVSEKMFVRIRNTVGKQPLRATGIKRKEIALKFSKTIKTILRKFALLNLTMEQIMANKVFPNGPYERPGSKEFIDYVKNGDYKAIENILISDVYHIYDYDLLTSQLKQTALHWAAKRGSPKIMKLLLEKGADPDATDLSGRTPLFLAAKGGYLTCVKLLLLSRADPTIRSGAERICLDYTTDANIRELITKAYKIHIRLSVLSYKKFKECWELADKRDFFVMRKELI